VQLLPLVFSSGWASGVNCYLVVLLLGGADRLVGLSQVPDALSRWDVLAAAALLYAAEFVLDKIPYVDSTWDAVSTAVRPTAGAVVALLLSGDAGSLDQAVLTAVGGGTALASHLVKAGLRAGINTSPEPVTNIAASVTEDLAVAGVVLLAVTHPRAAAVVAAVLLVLGAWLVVAVLRTARRVLRRRPRRAG
jgi:hypothetical protein